MEIAAVRGTRDVLPPESQWWAWVEDAARRICARYHYEEIRTPIFEQVTLFARGIGEVTDIVEKEMYTFVDRGGRELALRPEGTAGVVRAVLEHKLYAGPLPVKLFYVGPMFRYERPQAGRYRQFTQFGVEAFGSDAAALDAEIISLGISFLAEVGLKEWELRLNNIGCPVCRGPYRELLRTRLEPHRHELCASCQRRLERNPLRVLDCKEEGCRRLTEEIPPIDEYLCPACKRHWEAVQEHLAALDIPFRRYPRLVRGLDYYTRTVFELVAVGLGSQDAVLGGGRYDGLMEMMGGPSVPGIGFAAGLDRLLLSLEAAGALPERGPEVDLYVARVGAVPEAQILRLVTELRRRGLRVDTDFLGRSLKTQLKTADRLGAVFTLVAGEGEWERGEVLLRRMSDGSQEVLPREGLEEKLAERVAAASTRTGEAG